MRVWAFKTCYQRIFSDLHAFQTKTSLTLSHCIAILHLISSAGIFLAFPWHTLSGCRNRRFQPPVTINADVEVSTENVLATTFCSTRSLVTAVTAVTARML